jgi:anti-sigma regulatory factor (Ser/Thr protein kinase)
MHETRQFPNAPRAVTDARRFTIGAIGEVGRDVRDDVAVMVSELASNSVRHGNSQFVVDVQRTDEQIRVSVTDSAAGDPVVRNPTAREASGRGLQIVRALADEWGVLPRRDGPGKTVWFTVMLGAPSPV